MNKQRSRRNVIIFSIVTLGCGWLGVWVNNQVPSPSPQQSLGILIWVLSPFITGLILRGLGKDGWKDFGLRFNFKGNMGWYALAILVYPVTIALTLLLAAIFGAATFDGLMTQGLPALMQVIALGFAMSLVKNIGEEFAWRGYLTPRLQAIGLPRFVNHLLTGAIWGLWHIPYWLFFIGADAINSYTSMGMTGFVIMGLLGILPTAFIYGELRLKTNSLWPAYLAHNVTNAISAQLIINGFVKLNPNAQILFAPGTDGVIIMAIFWALGLWILGRQKNMKPSVEEAS